MRTPPQAQKHYGCSFCGILLPAWLPVAKVLDVAKVLAHLGQQPPDRVGASLDRMATDEDVDSRRGQGPSASGRSRRWATT